MSVRMTANGNFSDASVERFYSVSQNKSYDEPRAVSVALHTPQLGGGTLSQGAQNSSPVTTLNPRESFDPPNWNMKH